MIKVKYSALVEIELEVSERTPGVMPFERKENHNKNSEEGGQVI